MVKKVILLTAAACLLFLSQLRAETYDQQMTSLAQSVASSVETAGKTKVAILDFRDLNKTDTELGRFLANELCDNLINLGSTKKTFTVVDRAHMKAIVDEKKLSDIGLTDPETVAKLGQFSGADCLIIGTLSELGDEFRVSVKLLNTKNSENLGADHKNISKTKDLTRMWETKYPTAPTGVIVAPVSVSNNGNTVSTADASPSVDASGFKPGAKLDVWLRPDNFEGGIPKEPSLVTMIDNSGIFFNMARYADEKEMESNIGHPILQVWKCHLKIQKPGIHVIIGEFRRTPETVLGDNELQWKVQFSLDNEQLVDEAITFAGYGGDDRKFTVSRPFNKDLKPGFYEVKVIAWMPNQKRNWNYKPLTFALRVREPGASKPRDVGADDIFYKE